MHCARVPEAFRRRESVYANAVRSCCAATGYATTEESDDISDVVVGGVTFCFTLCTATVYDTVIITLVYVQCGYLPSYNTRVLIYVYIAYCTLEVRRRRQINGR